jgi:methyl-accepting chemotaxis protein
MIPSIIQLKQDVRELQEQFLSTEDKFDTLKAVHNELVDRVSQQSMMLEMLTAHVENLIERVHDLERPPFRA